MLKMIFFFYFKFKTMKNKFQTHGCAFFWFLIKNNKHLPNKQETENKNNIKWAFNSFLCEFKISLIYFICHVLLALNFFFFFFLKKLFLSCSIHMLMTGMILLFVGLKISMRFLQIWTIFSWTVIILFSLKKTNFIL